MTLVKNSTVKRIVKSLLTFLRFAVEISDRRLSAIKSSLGGASIRKVHEMMMAANTVKSKAGCLPSQVKNFRMPFVGPKQPST